MIIFIPKETHAGETRAAIVPEHVARIITLGATVEVESGLGDSCAHIDSEYAAAGATIHHAPAARLACADIVLKLRKPSLSEVSLLRAGTVLVGLLDPFQSPELIQALAAQGVSAISMELVPRTTRAQKMDVLSSQASLAGYAAVIMAAELSGKVFPMMMTPAGTIKPVKIFIIGAGVAGLQAIATARRLGAKVEAFDTRPAVEEQVKSLGAKFVQIDIGETGQAGHSRTGIRQARTDTTNRRDA
jgi:NAD(P) transhydrogenase subunit alpha